MFRKHIRWEMRCTKPDHRPMVSEFRRPGDAADIVAHELRCCYGDARLDQNQHWR